MHQRFGDTMGYSLTIYPDYAVLSRPDPKDERRKLSYSYRGGFDDPSTSAKGDDDVLVDLAAFDVKETVAILRGRQFRVCQATRLNERGIWSMPCPQRASFPARSVPRSFA